MSPQASSEALIGWASRDITPDRPALLRGQFYSRVSEGVLDPITVTALALAPADVRPEAAIVMVACDMVAIPNGLRDAVRERLKTDLPDLNPLGVCLHATHTHTAPGSNPSYGEEMECLPEDTGFSAAELGAMEPAENLDFAAERIAAAVAEAWRNREPGGIGFGLGQAVVGHNRRVSYCSGETRMYGKTDDPQFSHIEGGTDHGVNLLCTWNKAKKLTGMIVNVACPSQTSEHLFQISADYWHETRVELRRRFGPDLFVLPQCGAAGDQSPHIQVNKPAEERMWRLAGRTQRQEIAVRIADAATAILPAVEKEIDWAPILAHRIETLPLPLRPLSEKDVEEALAEADQLRKRYGKLRRDLEAHPEKKEQPRWYKEATGCYRRMIWCQNVEARFRYQRSRSDPALPVELHVMRAGGVAFATNPFEFYLDYGLQIKARSRAVQTFVVQLAGQGTYLPTLRATQGKSYGAIPASTPVGPEGGRLLVERTVEWINALWGE